MTDIVTISPLAPEQISIDYDALRKLGLEQLEKMAKAIWTDYNAHDPGITMLELLSYAITDLGHRISFPIEDLLTGENGKIDDQFFTAKEILTCNPLTIYDYRKLLVDLEGVRNAWLYVSKNSETNIYANCIDSTLEFVPFREDAPLQLNGLYNIKIDLDEDVDTTQVDAILQAAYRRLHSHRNICEDFYCMEVVEEDPFGLCTEIEIENDADVEAIEAQIIFEIEKFLNPPVPFYSLSAMYAMGKSSEEIFEGKVLDNGFINKEDLAKSSLKAEIHSSDLYNIIMGIEGVISIKQLLLIKYTDTLPPVAVDSGQPWVLNISLGKKPVMRQELNRITYYKETIIPYQADSVEVADKVDILRILDEQANAVDNVRDIEIPLGEYFDFKDYISIQEDLPETYGVSEFGLSNPSEERQAQVKQLKGYLLFFDQLLANFLAQLFQAKEMFSVSQVNESTYFTQLVLDAPNVRELFSDFTGLTDEQWEAFKAKPSTLQRFKDLMEDDNLRQDRLNRTLDHLLARFSENFSDYALLMFQFGGGTLRTIDDIIEDKRNFLSEYPVLSRDRALAYDYSLLNDEGEPDIWDTANIAGLKRRVARLMGVDDVNRQTLAPEETTDLIVLPIFRNGRWDFRYRLYDLNGATLLISRGAYSSTTNGHTAAMDFLSLMEEPENIQAKPNKRVFLYRPGTTTWVARSGVQASFEAAQALAEKIKGLFGCVECPPKLLYIQPLDRNDFATTFNYQLVAEDETLLLSSWDDVADAAKYYDNIGDARIAVQAFARALRLPDNYTVEDNADDYYLQVKESDVVVAQSPLQDTQTEALALKNTIQQITCCELCGEEGFYLVEHILLRPRNDNYQNLIPVCISCDDCECCYGLKDPYSFRISVVLPYWPERFRDRNFRKYFERILRLETPAHIALKICWVDCSQMSQFEATYKNWLEKKGMAFNNWLENDISTVPCQNYPVPNAFENDLTTATDDLVAVLFNLTNVYPSAKFHDCSDDESTGGIILGSTTLGEF